MPNAVQLIKQDHKKVASLFEKYNKTKGQEAKQRIAEQAMQQLEVHAQIEEEIFYPAVRKELNDAALVNEALKEHKAVKELIEELKIMAGEDDEFEEKWAELVADVKHHVQEEESELLPQAEESEMDLSDYGQQMAERKKELIDEDSGSSDRHVARPGSRSRKSAKHADPRD
jgi:hemerythrin superfamily protein